MSLLPEEVTGMMSRARCLFDQTQVEAALDKMALAITEKLSDKNPVFLFVMNGAVIAMGQLMTRLNFPLEVDYIHASRYRGEYIDNNAETRGGDLKWYAKPRTDLKARTVVLVEDILDTGLTLAALVDHCRQEGATDVYTAALVDKDHPRSEGGVQNLDFAGLHAPDEFLIGYGLDYQEYFRNLPGIYVLADEDIPA